MGSILEELVISTLCGAIGARNPVADAIWLEPAINPSTGRPVTDGLNCTAGIRISPKGSAFPDIVISPFKPATEVGGKPPEGWPKRDFLAVEIKLGVNTAYNKWRSSNNSQRRAIGNHASDYQYFPGAFLFAAFGEKKGSGQELQIKRWFIKDFQVIMSINTAV